MEKRVAVYNNNTGVIETMSSLLAGEGLKMVAVTGRAQLQELLRAQEIQLLLLDVELDGRGWGEGIEMIHDIRNMTTIPIIIISAQDAETAKIMALNAGADDYVTKPYRVKELLARVAVNIRRYTQARQTSQENSNRVVTFGNTIFDGKAFVLTQHGEKLDCTTSELRLLRFLLQHRGQVISRSAIMEQLYDIDGEFFEDNTLSVYIKRLRQKLGEDGAYIETVRGMGYRFRK